MKVKGTVIALVLLCNFLAIAADGGSWNSGYDCPKVTFKCNGVTTTEATDFYIYPKPMENPVGEASRQGWQWKAPNAKKVLKSFLVEREGKTFFPYRFFDGKWGFTNPAFKNKYLQGWATNDEGLSCHITIYLPYNFWKTYVDDNEGRKMRDLLNRYSVAQKGDITTKKVEARNSAATILTNKPVLQGLQGSAADVQAAYNQLNQRSDELETLIAQAKSKKDSLQLEINNLQGEINNKEDEQANLLAYRESWSAQLREIDVSLAQTESEDKTTAQKIAEYQEHISLSENELEEETAVLKNLVEGIDHYLDEAKNAIINLDGNASDLFNEHLNRFIPK